MVNLKLDDALKSQEEAHKRKMKLRGKKGTDYAHPETDCLTNFKVIADIAEVCEKYGYKIDITKAWGTAAWHLLHKLVRLLKLYNSNTPPQNESAIDSHDDLENYSELMKECYIDENTPIIDEKEVKRLVKRLKKSMSPSESNKVKYVEDTIN